MKRVLKTKAGLKFDKFGDTQQETGQFDFFFILVLRNTYFTVKPMCIQTYIFYIYKNYTLGNLPKPPETSTTQGTQFVPILRF